MFCAIFSAIVFFILLLLVSLEGTEDIENIENIEEITNKHKNILKASFYTFVISLIFASAIPSKKELYLIYGVGSTIEYLKSNPNAKELPDKCIKALERWADSVNEENNKDSE